MMMGTSRPGADAERDLLEELKQIRGRFPTVNRELAGFSASGAEITDRMRVVRGEPLARRLELYRADRIDDQIAWYSRNAGANASKESGWGIGIVVVEALAIMCAVARLVYAREYNPTGAIAASASCLLAWTHAKRFSDLASTYAVACRDLADLKTRAEHVADEASFEVLVGEVENAISREHRLWVAKRSAV